MDTCAGKVVVRLDDGDADDDDDEDEDELEVRVFIGMAVNMGCCLLIMIKGRC